MYIYIYEALARPSRRAADLTGRCAAAAAAAAAAVCSMIIIYPTTPSGRSACQSLPLKDTSS